MLKAIPKLRKILEVEAALHSLFPASDCQCFVLCPPCTVRSAEPVGRQPPAAQHGAGVPGGPADTGAEVLVGLCMAVHVDTWAAQHHRYLPQGTAAPGPP